MTRSKVIKVPLYPVHLLVCVTDDILRARKRYDRQLGKTDLTVNPAGLCSYNGNAVGLFFSRKSLSHEVVVHEIFHATHRILEYCGDRFSPKHHEPYAFLAGHLAAKVFRLIRCWEEELKE